MRGKHVTDTEKVLIASRLASGSNAYSLADEYNVDVRTILKWSWDVNAIPRNIPHVYEEPQWREYGSVSHIIRIEDGVNRLIDIWK